MIFPEEGCPNRIVIHHGDAREFAKNLTDDDLAIIDPPWNCPDLFAVGSHAKNRLVFCDGGRAFDAISANGPPAWIFTWDCVTSWYTPNRPLRRQKLALWYGDVSKYNQSGARHGDPCGKPRTVKNTRSEYLFVPNPGGKMLSDVFQCPITSLRKTQQYTHAKPFDWCLMLVANCNSGTRSVFDLFAGSGVFMDVAKQLGMSYVGVELNDSRYSELASRVNQQETTATKPEQQSWL